MPQDAVRHFGFAAVDFGTTNSTVTIHDMRQLDVRAMSRHQEARLREELADVLSDPDACGAERAQWRELLADVARQYLDDPATAHPDPAAGGRALAEALSGGYGGEGWVHALYTALELRVASRDERLRRAAAPLLHRCYHRAFDELPLDVLRLFPADLDHAGGKELPSRIEVVQTLPELRVRMGEERIAVGGLPAGGGRSYRGVKQYLGRDHPIPGLEAVTADDLIREGLRYLLDQTDEYIAANPKEYHQGKIDHVVMTYPTVAPPAVRRRLRELVGGGPEGAGGGLGVTLVDTQFDEAVAAALFFIMRDFGGDFVAGVEAFRARCRPLPGTDRAWQQNVLVADIGGGTFDVALINLHLKDATPDPPPGQDPRFTGRLYVLTPTLLGSTGHLQLGGDLMTLRLFRWYKGALADHLITHAPERYEHVVGSLKKPYAVDGRYVPRTLLDRGHDDPQGYPADLVDRVVPTRWSDDSVVSAAREDAEQTFWLLWRLAEEAKIQLGAGEPVHHPLPEVLDALLGRLGAAGATEAGGGAWAPLLDAETFAALLAPDLEDIMDLVVALTKNIVTGTELDRIFLTGKSSRMPLVRQVLERRLRQESEVRWNPAGVAVEEEYGKLATSIGACWGHHVRRFAHSVRNAQGVLGRGRYVLRIEVDNLSYYLPCDFGPTYQLAANDPTHALLQVGAQLSPIGPGGGWAVRSKWQSLPASLRVHRNLGTGWEEWGAFDPDAWVRLKEPDFTLNMAEWTRDARFQLEVNADLDLTVHLSRGAPRYEVDAAAPIRIDFGTGPEGAWVPVEVVADNRVAGDRPDAGVVVFSLPRDPRLRSEGEGVEGVDAPRFDEVFRVREATDTRPVRGMTSEPIGSPPPDGWSFYLRYPGEPERKWDLLGVVPVPESGDVRAAPDEEPSEQHKGVVYVATLDEGGWLRVHRAPVPYWTADSIAGIWHAPGSVFRVQMSGTSTSYRRRARPVQRRALTAVDALRRLGRLPGTPLGVLARAQLAGLHAALSVALDALPDDAGAAECRAALAEITAALLPDEAKTPFPPPDAPAPRPEAAFPRPDAPLAQADAPFPPPDAACPQADAPFPPPDAAFTRPAVPVADTGTPPMGTPVPPGAAAVRGSAYGGPPPSAPAAGRPAAGRAGRGVDAEPERHGAPGAAARSRGGGHGGGVALVPSDAAAAARGPRGAVAVAGVPVGGCGGRARRRAVGGVARAR
ncbi:hypothetical protein RB200_24155 [Streptomyces sp. PmtG]